MSVAVIVPTYRRPVDLERCLRALAAQTRQPDRIVVVVRQSDDESRRALAELERVLPPFESATVDVPGQIAAIQAGLRRCREDIVAHTDDDAAPRPDWIERLLRRYTDGVGGVGGRDVIEQPAQRPGGDEVVGKLSWFGRLIGNHHAGAGRARDVDVLKTVNMSLRRELWRLDPNLRGDGAQIHMEVGICLQARRDGWRLVYDPDAQVDHYPAARHDDDERDNPTTQARANVEWNYAYVLSRYLPAWRVPFAAAYVLGVGTRWAPGLVAWVEACVRRPDSRKPMTKLFLTLTASRAAGLAAGLRGRMVA